MNIVIVNPNTQNMGERLGITPERMREFQEIAQKVAAAGHGKTEDLSEIYRRADPQNMNEMVFIAYGYAANVEAPRIAHEKLQEMAGQAKQFIEQIRRDNPDMGDKSGVRLIRG